MSASVNGGAAAKANGNAKKRAREDGDEGAGRESEKDGGKKKRIEVERVKESEVRSIPPPPWGVVPLESEISSNGSSSTTASSSGATTTTTVGGAASASATPTIVAPQPVRATHPIVVSIPAAPPGPPVGVWAGRPVESVDGEPVKKPKAAVKKATGAGAGAGAKNAGNQAGSLLPSSATTTATPPAMVVPYTFTANLTSASSSSLASSSSKGPSIFGWPPPHLAHTPSSSTDVVMEDVVMEGVSRSVTVLPTPPGTAEMGMGSATPRSSAVPRLMAGFSSPLTSAPSSVDGRVPRSVSDAMRESHSPLPLTSTTLAPILLPDMSSTPAMVVSPPPLASGSAPATTITPSTPRMMRKDVSVHLLTPSPLRPPVVSRPARLSEDIKHGLNHAHYVCLRTIAEPDFCEGDELEILKDMIVDALAKALRVVGMKAAGETEEVFSARVRSFVEECWELGNRQILVEYIEGFMTKNGFVGDEEPEEVDTMPVDSGDEDFSDYFVPWPSHLSIRRTHRTARKTTQGWGAKPVPPVPVPEWKRNSRFTWDDNEWARQAYWKALAVRDPELVAEIRAEAKLRDEADRYSQSTLVFAHAARHSAFPSAASTSAVPPPAPVTEPTPTPSATTVVPASTIAKTATPPPIQPTSIESTLPPQPLNGDVQGPHRQPSASASTSTSVTSPTSTSPPIPEPSHSAPTSHGPSPVPGPSDIAASASGDVAIRKVVDKLFAGLMENFGRRVDDSLAKALQGVMGGLKATEESVSKILLANATSSNSNASASAKQKQIPEMKQALEALLALLEGNKRIMHLVNASGESAEGKFGWLNSTTERVFDRVNVVEENQAVQTTKLVELLNDLHMYGELQDKRSLEVVSATEGLRKDMKGGKETIAGVEGRLKEYVQEEVKGVKELVTKLGAEEKRRYEEVLEVVRQESEKAAKARGTLREGEEDEDERGAVAKRRKLDADETMVDVNAGIGPPGPRETTRSKAKKVLDLMRNMAGLLDLDEDDDELMDEVQEIQQQVAASVKGKEREVVRRNSSAAPVVGPAVNGVNGVGSGGVAEDGSESAVLRLLLEEFRLIKEQMRVSERRTREEIASIRLLHAAELESLRNELAEKEEAQTRRWEQERERLRAGEGSRIREPSRSSWAPEDHQYPPPSAQEAEILELKRRLSFLESTSASVSTPLSISVPPLPQHPSILSASARGDSPYQHLPHLRERSSSIASSSNNDVNPASYPTTNGSAWKSAGTPLAGNGIEAGSSRVGDVDGAPLPVKQQRKLMRSHGPGYMMPPPGSGE
ncbi:hypothetical protein DFP72DRAFT_932712 [Ephemerocybe angulata]|uniref:Uncharacterized protein n=1 Tax=Ephemerocybe angulata TaxID=980116 RepID=A0A8H6HBV9_9AGAR|nr:hypothetical protein DFP72DRAFT_932712 [Tulosesus angulatus]